MSKNAPDCISARMHLRKFQGRVRGGNAPGPPRETGGQDHSGLLPQTKNPTYNRERTAKPDKKKFRFQIYPD